MKFKVREGFVVHHTTLVKVVISGEEVNQPQTNSYYQGQTVDFTAEEAEEHLHKLEAADKEAQKYLDSRAVPTPGATVSGTGMDAATLAQVVAAAVAQALAAQQASAPSAQPGAAAA